MNRTAARAASFSGKVKVVPLRLRSLVLLGLLWTLFVMYPNPLRLALSVARVFDPPVDPAAVAALVPLAPRQPAAIEAFVLKAFPYRHDWQTSGMPWDFPTAAEAVAKGAGDCKTRFVVLASLFKTLVIRYQETVSLSHFWVTYEGKKENELEQEKSAWLVRDEAGRLRFQLPREDPGEVWGAFKEAFWQTMPPVRKGLWLGGLAFVGGATVRLGLSGERRRNTALS